MHTKLAMLLAALVLVVGCGAKSTVEPDAVGTQVAVMKAAAQTLTSEATALWTDSPTETPSPRPSDTEAPEPTPTPTETQAKPSTPTVTLVPTNTPSRVATKTPTASSTPAPTVATEQPTPKASQAPVASAAPAASATSAPVAKASLATGRIAFSAGGQLHVADAATGQDTIAPIPDFQQPDLRADGELVIAKGFQGPKTSLWTIDANTGQFIREQGRFSDDFRPAWSSDGSYFTYDSLHQGLKRQVLYTQKLDSKEDEFLTYRDAEIRGTSPVWMHDDWIAFTACDYWPKATEGSKCGIYRKQASGGDPKMLKPDSLEVRATDSFGGQLVFMSHQSGDWELYVVSADGGDERNLSNSATSQDGLGTFSPDGKLVAFVSDRGGSWAIWVVALDGTGLAKLFDLPAPPTGDWTGERISWGP
ncbi:hypothetical protein ACFLWA_00995 [Chloroflexota bacterium]